MKLFYITVEEEKIAHRCEMIIKLSMDLPKLSFQLQNIRPEKFIVPVNKMCVTRLTNFWTTYSTN